MLIELCKIKLNEKVVVLTETLSRQINISLVEFVLKDLSLKYKKIEIDESFPNHIVKNKEKFKEWII